MTTLKVVKQCLERIVPLRLAEKWDNVSHLSSNKPPASVPRDQTYER